MGKSWLSIKIIHVMICISVIAVSSVSLADEYRAWTGDFMRMGAGARALGMGNAYTAVGGDIYSSYFNPAGLAYMTEKQFTFSFRYLTMDRMFRYFAIGSPTGPDAGFALSWMNAGTDDITGRDLNGNPTGNLDDERNAFTLSFAKSITEKLSIGLNTKYVLWKLAGDDAKAFGFDFGIMATPWRTLTVSANARDLRSRFTWKSDRWKKYINDADGQPMEKEDRFPKYYTLGVSYKFFGEKLILASTAESIENYPVSFDAGISYKYNKTFTLRTGFYNYNSSDELDYGSYTAGFSLGITNSMAFDYAYLTDGFDDGAIHAISFVMGYGD